MEDVRLNRKKRFETGSVTPAASPANTTIVGRRAGRTALNVSTNGAGIVVKIPGSTAAVPWVRVWTSTAEDLDNTFTLEEFGDAVTMEFVAEPTGVGTVVYFTDVYLDAQ
jgi:hypothetical protein